MAKKNTGKLILADDTPAANHLTPSEYIWEEHDSSYIPGYAECIKANDLATSRTIAPDIKDKFYRQWGTGPREMPIDFVYLRMTNAAGGVSHSAAVDRMVYTQAGYTICKKDDFLALMDKYPEILKGTPWEAGSAILEPDNTIRRLDSALFVVETDNPRYQAWQRRRAENNARFNDMRPQPDGPHGYAEIEEQGQFEGTAYERS